MIFNPMFLQPSDSNGTFTINIPGRLSGSSYLFSDIMKIFFTGAGPEPAIQPVLPAQDAGTIMKLIPLEFKAVSEKELSPQMHLEINNTGEIIIPQVPEQIILEFKKLFSSQKCEADIKKIIEMDVEEYEQLAAFISELVPGPEPGTILPVQESPQCNTTESSDNFKTGSDTKVSMTKCYCLAISSGSKSLIINLPDYTQDEINEGNSIGIKSSETAKVKVELIPVDNTANKNLKNVLPFVLSGESNVGNIETTPDLIGDLPLKITNHSFRLSKSSLQYPQFEIDTEPSETVTDPQEGKVLLRQEKSELLNTNDIKQNITEVKPDSEIVKNDLKMQFPQTQDIVKPKVTLFEYTRQPAELNKIQNIKAAGSELIDRQDIIQTDKMRETVNDELLNGLKILATKFEGTETKKNTEDFRPNVINKLEVKKIYKIIEELKPVVDAKYDLPEIKKPVYNNHMTDTEYKESTQVKNFVKENDFNPDIKKAVAEAKKIMTDLKPLFEDKIRHEELIRTSEPGSNRVSINPEVNSKTSFEQKNIFPEKNSSEIQIEKTDEKLVKPEVEHTELDSTQRKSEFRDQSRDTEIKRENTSAAKPEKSKTPDADTSGEENFNNPKNQENSIHLRTENTAKQHINNEINFDKEISGHIKDDVNLRAEKFVDSTFKNLERIFKNPEIMQDVIKSFNKQGASSITLKLEPEFLGELKLTVQTADHMVKAHIQVDSEAARVVIEKNLAELQSLLSKQGLQLNLLQVTVNDTYNKNHKSHYGKKRGYSSPGKFHEEKNDVPSQVRSLGYNTYEYLV